MGRGLGDILATLSLFVPPWVLAVLAGVTLLLLLPKLRYRIRDKQIKEAIRRHVRAEPAAQRALEIRVLDRAAEDIPLILTGAREARKRSIPTLQAALETRLEATAEGRRALRDLRQEVARPVADPMHPAEVVLRVQRMLDEGLVEAARLRLDEGLAHHPEHAELLAMRSSMDA